MTTLADRKHVLRLACACDRLEIKVLCERGNEDEGLMGETLPQIWPWISLAINFLRKPGGLLRSGLFWGLIARLFAVFV